MVKLTPPEIKRGDIVLLEGYLLRLNIPVYERGRQAWWRKWHIGLALHAVSLVLPAPPGYVMPSSSLAVADTSFSGI